jgi:hypothetical protein
LQRARRVSAHLAGDFQELALAMAALAGPLAISPGGIT